MIFATMGPLNLNIMTVIVSIELNVSANICLE